MVSGTVSGEQTRKESGTFAFKKPTIKTYGPKKKVSDQVFGPKNMKTQHDFHKPDQSSQSLLFPQESFKSTFVDYSDSMAELPQ